MTLLIAGIGLTVTMLVGIVLGSFTALAADRSRAQMAADAAALAAVAESVPGAAGDPHGAARRFTESNGGSLISCECVLGSTSVEVTVEVNEVRARARATLDPNAFLPASMGVDARGLHPRMADAVQRLIVAARGRVRVVSGWRSSQHQEDLWAAAVARYGDPEVADNWVARPGSSMHERGLAVDLGGDVEAAAALVADMDLPLHRPLQHEPWHFELVGSR